jgi:hypothetical protein
MEKCMVCESSVEPVVAEGRCEACLAEYRGWDRYQDNDIVVAPAPFICYQCDKATTYLFDDSRCASCTRLTPEEVRGEVVEHENHVHYFSECPAGSDARYWYSGYGWYWADETALLIGPYKTVNAAQAALNEYCQRELASGLAI